MRGLLLGLVVGDAVGVAHGTVPTGAAPLRNSVAAQLACVTTDGLIRAAVRQNSKGICHPPSVVWHALVRWAHGQGIDARMLYEQWGDHQDTWPDGWLARVPLLRERHGNAPATVAALKSAQQGTRREPTTSSAGSHAVTRTLPAAALTQDLGYLHELAADIAVQTHGSPAGFITAADTAVITACCVTGDRVHEALTTGVQTITRIDPGTHHADVFAAAIGDGSAGCPNQHRLRTHYAIDRGATQTVAGALYAAAAHPQPAQFLTAVTFASAAPGVAAVTGALLGAVHGVDVLPVEVLSRCELTWVADTLARDLVTQLTESPAGHERLQPTGPNQYTVGWQDGSEPAWWQRYPGW